jgi:2-iminobutanoate/2-iminopropanoate deaminase
MPPQTGVDALPIARVSTPQAPTPAGHYAQATVHNGTVYVAGQLSIDPATGEKVHGSIEEQTERTLRNVEAILLAAGSDFAHLLKVNVYVTDIAHWPRVNAVYARVVGADVPARAVVPVPALNHGLLIEIDAIAAVRG